MWNHSSLKLSKPLCFAVVLCVLTTLSACEKTPVDEDFSSPSDTTIHRTDTLAAPQSNLLVNGDMEQWVMFAPYDILDGWYCHNNYNMRREYQTVYSGRYSAKMQSRKKGSTATVDQSVQVVPGSKIRICFHYYVEEWKQNGARTYCYFKTRSAKSTNLSAAELRAFYDDDTYCIIRGGGYGKKYLPVELKQWQTFDEVITVPPTANYFTFGVNSYYGTTIYIDECHVSECP